MKLFDKEFYELLEQFEKDAKNLASHSLRFDKEKKEFWQLKQVYQHGETNELFKLYGCGYSFGKSIIS